MASSKPRFTDDDFFRELKAASVLEIGSALNSDLPQNWIALATRLGLGNDEIEQLRCLPNPGYGVLRRWNTRPNTTIRVFRNALIHMKRSDVIDLLNKAVTDPTDVTIVIRCDGEVYELTHGEVPGLTTLVEYVRPHIHSRFGQFLAKGVTFARLVNVSTRSNQSWTSPVTEFMGQQIEIELFRAQRRQVRSEADCRPVQHYRVQRDCQSYMENDLLVFEVGAYAASGPRSPESSHSTSSSMRFENTEPGQRPPNSKSEHFSWSPVRQCSSPVPPEDFSCLPGFHLELPTDETRRTRAEEVLKGSLMTNGAYILRRTTIENGALSLSVVYNRQVIHFSIMKSVTAGLCNYFIFNSSNFTSVSKLIEFYSCHALYSEATRTNTRGLLLTTPIP